MFPAAVLLIACLSLPAFAQQPSGAGSDQRSDRALNTLQRTLNLSSSQVTQIRQLTESRRDSLRTIREQARPKFEQLMSMLKQPNPDPAAVGRVVVDLKGIHEQARAKQKEFEQQLSTILTPAQQQTVNNLRSQAETFGALRRLGLLGARDFPQGMFMSRMMRPEMRGADEDY